MKRAVIFPLFLAVFASTMVSRANITGVVWNGASGELSSVWYSVSGPSGDYTGGTLYANQTGDGGMGWTLSTDTPTDPAFAVTTDVFNTSGFIWTSYLVDVSMGTAFTFSGVANSVPGDWSVTVQDPGAPVAGVYTGHLIFNAGTPIGLGSEFKFDYTVNFSGGPNINFNENLTPVPEPGTLSLLAVSGVLFMIARRRR